MTSQVRVRVTLNQAVLDRELNDRDGAAGAVLAGFAAEVTKEIKAEFKSSAGGAWWPVESTIFSGPRGAHFTTTVKKTRAHQIIAKNKSNLVFFWQREGRMFRGPMVNHPGSSPPIELVLSGIRRAGRKVKFTRAAPRVTETP